jgi:hypothetical protein
MIKELFKGLFKSPASQAKDEYWSNLEIDKALHKNGNISERAKIEGRSLDYMERQIILAVRRMAAEHGVSIKMINMIEMEGERNRGIIYKPIKVVARFAYYESAYYGHPAEPSYHIIESNHPVLLVGGNFGREEFIQYGIKPPRAPSFERWVRQGRPCFRGK